MRSLDKKCSPCNIEKKGKNFSHASLNGNGELEKRKYINLLFGYYI